METYPIREPINKHPEVSADSGQEEFTEEKIGKIVAAQRKYFRTGATLPIKWRIHQLEKLKAAVITHKKEFEEALAEDLGRSQVYGTAFRQGILYRLTRCGQACADREHPLAMYLFTKNKKWANRVMRTRQYGGGCINEVCIHMMAKGVPFNGTGHSGMGAYHGQWGFREFTHPQTVLQGKTIFNLPLREHPYTGKAGETKMKILKVFKR